MSEPSVWLIEWRYRDYVPSPESKNLWTPWEVYPTGTASFSQPQLPDSDEYTEYRAAEYKRVKAEAGKD